MELQRFLPGLPFIAGYVGCHAFTQILTRQLHLTIIFVILVAKQRQPISTLYVRYFGKDRREFQGFGPELINAGVDIEFTLFRLACQIFPGKIQRGVRLARHQPLHCPVDGNNCDQSKNQNQNGNRQNKFRSYLHAELSVGNGTFSPDSMIGHLSGKKLISFHPETAFSRCSSVNLQAYLYGVTVYASAQALDFLATTENCSFPI